MSRSVARITPLVDEALLDIVDRHKGTLTRAGAIRISLLELARERERSAKGSAGERQETRKRQLPLELDPDLLARLQALVRAGRASSIAELVRDACLRFERRT